MIRLLACACLAGCAAFAPPASPTAPLGDPPSLFSVDTLARGRMGQMVMTGGATTIDLRFKSVAADTIRADQDGVPLAVPTRRARSLVLFMDPPPDRRPTYAAAACATPYALSILDRTLASPGEPGVCTGRDATIPGLLIGGALISFGVYSLSPYVLPAWPRGDLVIPIAPLSRFSDAPREGVGLLRPTD